MDAQAISKLAQNLPQDSKARAEIVDAARKLMIAAETPEETYQRVIFSQVAASIAHVAMDMGVFRLLASNPAREWQAQEIAANANADIVFTERLLRSLSSYDMLAQLGPTSFKATNITISLAHEAAEAMSANILLLTSPMLRALPAYMKSTKYQNPSDPAHTAFHDAYNTKMEIMPWFGANPDFMKIVFNAMKYQRTFQKGWMEQPGIMNRLDFKLSAEDIKRGRALFVDVGGSAGHQCIALRETHPEFKGKVILQDLAMMTDMAQANPKLKELDIVAQAHDFLTPESPEAKGAKVFYIRNVLHDWNDKKNTEILRHVKDAMADDSVLIIDELNVPEMHSSKSAIDRDLIMMTFPAAMERTEKMWRSLIEQQAGLHIREIICYDPSTDDSLIIVSRK